MNKDRYPAPIERILAENPEVERLRIDLAKREVEAAFNGSLPGEKTLERIDSALTRDLPCPGELVHPPQACHHPATAVEGSPVRFHHHHFGEDIVEFHREHTRSDGPVVWRKFKIPTWRHRSLQRAHDADYQTMLLVSAVCGISALFGYFLERSEASVWAIGAAFTLAYVAGGWFAAREVFANLRHGKIDVHFLMLVVAIGAVFIRGWREGATLLFLFSLSGGLEQFAHYRTRRAISSLFATSPKRAVRRAAGAWVEVPIQDVHTADELLIKPGELFPVDGTLLDGITAVDESALTGESLPAEKRAGDHVSGGTLNLEGQAIIRVERLPRDSAMQRIVALIESAQQQKAPAQRFTDVFSRYYTWAVLIFSAAVFVILVASKHPLAESFYRTMTLLVVASPCALVLSIPSAILVAIASGARHGILFRGGVAVENLAEIDQFAFDKTGTLTKGKLKVARIITRHHLSEDEVLRLAASVAQSSTHPLSRAVVSEANSCGLAFEPSSEFKNIAGAGMQARIGDAILLVGSRAFLESRGIATDAEEGERTQAEVWIADTALLGTIYLSDEVRPEAKSTIQQLHRGGAAVALLTGDHAAAAAEIASLVGIRDVRARLSPSDKLDCVHRWHAEGRKVAMVGDGINDAPSLTAADVALAMGGRGSDAALEQADVVLMHDKIEKVAEAVELSRRARTIIHQNLTISLGVILVLVVSALFNQIGLSLGVIGHEGSTVLVVLNGLRLLHFPNAKKH